MVGMPGLGIRNQLDKTEWKVFVQSKCTGNRHLDGNTQLLYQVSLPRFFFIQILATVTVASEYTSSGS